MPRGKEVTVKQGLRFANPVQPGDDTHTSGSDAERHPTSNSSLNVKGRKPHKTHAKSNKQGASSTNPVVPPISNQVTPPVPQPVAAANFEATSSSAVDTRVYFPLDLSDSFLNGRGRQPQTGGEPDWMQSSVTSDVVQPTILPTAPPTPPTAQHLHLPESFAAVASPASVYSQCTLSPSASHSPSDLHYPPLSPYSDTQPPNSYLQITSPSEEAITAVPNFVPLAPNQQASHFQVGHSTALLNAFSVTSPTYHLGLQDTGDSAQHTAARRGRKPRNDDVKGVEKKSRDKVTAGFAELQEALDELPLEHKKIHTKWRHHLILSDAAKVVRCVGPLEEKVQTLEFENEKLRRRLGELGELEFAQPIASTSKEVPFDYQRYHGAIGPTS